MPAATRRSSRNTSFEKKLPKQIYFPHRRKIVREKPANVDYDAKEPKQMLFVKEKMRVGNMVLDSEGEDEDEEELSSLEPVVEADKDGVEQRDMVDKEDEEPVTGGKKGKKRSSNVMQQQDAEPVKSTRNRKKRSSDVMQQDEKEDEEPVKGRKKGKRSSDVIQQEGDQDAQADTEQPAQKRRRQPAKKLNRRASAVKAEPQSDEEPPSGQRSVSPSKLETEKDRRTGRRRQSTMTQLVDGRKPLDGENEPEFRPVRRTPRLSWSNSKSSKERDEKQRTLTQMVPGLTMFPATDDEEIEEELEDDTGFGAALTEQLKRSGIFEPIAEPTLERHTRASLKNTVETTAEDSQLPPPFATHSAEFGADEDTDPEDEYHPTQYIPAPATRRRPTPRRASGKQNMVPSPAPTSVSTPRRKTRFSLLATPERRKVFEIPSSQSPSGSSLSTQLTPHREASPLKVVSGNTQKVPDTPSKLKKVTFDDVVETVKPVSAPKRKFASQIPDSEDEDELLEDEIENIVSSQPIGAETQMVISGINHLVRSKNVGTETQAMLEQIDKACANAEEDRDSPEELDGQSFGLSRDEGSQELGVQWSLEQRECQEVSRLLPSSPPLLGHTGVEQEVQAETQYTGTLPTMPSTQLEQAVAAESSSVRVEDATESSNLPTPQGVIPSSPQHLQPMLTQGTLDLDGYPAVEVARSPPPLNRTETQETGASHSSKAERQLQQEWSISQFPESIPLPLPSSSIHGHFHTTSSSPQPPPIPSSTFTIMSAGHINKKSFSQATTIPDLTQRSPQTTPRRNTSTQRPVIPSSVTVTPTKSRAPSIIPNSQPSPAGISPERPATLFVPSSYPSPSRNLWRGGIGAEWSSPVMEAVGERGVLGSLEDFSIPSLPPPDTYMEVPVEDEEESEMEL